MSGETVGYLREQKARCLRLAELITDKLAADVLRNMAEEYERRARALEQEPPSPEGLACPRTPNSRLQRCRIPMETTSVGSTAS